MVMEVLWPAIGHRHYSIGPQKTGVIVLRNVGGGFNVSDLARRALTEVATAKSRN